MTGLRRPSGFAGPPHPADPRRFRPPSPPFSSPGLISPAAPTPSPLDEGKGAGPGRSEPPGRFDPGTWEQVRLMRACRVIRLFGRFSELKKMVAAVSASVLAMMHSFFIFILVMCICELPLPPTRWPCMICTFHGNILAYRDTE